MSRAHSKEDHLIDMKESELHEGRARIKVVGCGGGGGNAVNRMISKALKVQFIAVNTDKQALERCQADVKVQIGSKVTRGLGAGGDWTRGRDAADKATPGHRMSHVHGPPLGRVNQMLSLQYASWRSGWQRSGASPREAAGGMPSDTTPRAAPGRRSVSRPTPFPPGWPREWTASQAAVADRRTFPTPAEAGRA